MGYFRIFRVHASNYAHAGKFVFKASSNSFETAISADDKLTEVVQDCKTSL